MKKYILNTLMWGVLALGASGCTEKYLDINSNPYEPGDLNPDDYALGSAMNNLAGTVVSADVNTAQFTDCLLGGPCGGYFADSGAWAFSISNFNATNDWTRVFMMSDQIIPVLYSNLNQVQIVSQNTDNPVPYAIAMIIKVAAMSRVTDTYGPIPYTQIGVDGRVTVPYDSQETVYNAFFDELDEAIATLSENSSSALVPTADYVYSGNVQQWIKFANSLKLRLAMRISYANPAKAREMAESAVNQEFGVIESNEDNAAWHYFGSITNPLFTAINYNGDESRPSAEIVCYMNGYNDNRRASYFVNEDGAFDSDVYVGLRRRDFYEQGIRLSFAQWGASGEDDYIEDDRSVPQTYTDPAGFNSYASTISDITIKWDESASTEEKQERIITQKWIANWMLGSEAWADYRRTGYPRLIPAPAAGNKSGGVVDSNRGARRMPYPSEENANNYENVQYARDHYLNGPDNMATDVWWACK